MYTKQEMKKCALNASKKSTNLHLHLYACGRIFM